MPSRRKLDPAKVNASFDTLCTQCAYAIPPAELLYVDSKRIRCPQCGAEFEPKSKSKPGFGQVGMVEPG